MRYAFIRFRRRPFMMLAVILFAAILVAVLCGLQRNIDNEIAEYEETYRAIPVTVRMCDLKGEKYDDLEGDTYVMNVFRSDYEMGRYLKEIQLKGVYKKARINIDGRQITLKAINGITTLDIDSELAQRKDTAVAWLGDYDESVLQTNELVCIIPETMMPNTGGEIPTVLLEVIEVRTDGRTYNYENIYKYNVKVIGAHKADTSEVFVPFDTLVSFCRKMMSYNVRVAAASATVADNYLIDELKSEAYEWFAQPNDNGENTPWGYSYFVYYPTALEIDDSKLIAATEAMENSLKINRLCAYIVLALSAVAGFFAAFLSIRSRKREITLMRSLGNSGFGIFMGYTFEQLVCLVLGTAIGGAAFRWQPAEQIGMFLGIYFLGLTLALIIFVSRNLLSGQKEDE